MEAAMMRSLALFLIVSLVLGCHRRVMMLEGQ